jgi:ATP-dependent Lon protease
LAFRKTNPRGRNGRKPDGRQVRGRVGGLRPAPRPHRARSQAGPLGAHGGPELTLATPAQPGGPGRRLPARLRPLPPGRLRWHCPHLKPSRRRPKVTDLLGQTRPLLALRLGLQLYAQGYHIFVSGIMGTGRMILVQHLLEELRPACRLGPDRVYVNNLLEPNRPQLLTLPRGKAPQFQRDMEELVQRIQDGLQAALRSRPHKSSRKLVIKAAELRERRLMDALARQARHEGCALVRFQAQSGSTTADIYPLHDGEAISVEALQTLVLERKLTPAARDQLLAARDELLERLAEISERSRELMRRTERELRAMDRRVAGRVLEIYFRDFLRTWRQPEVLEYLQSVRQHVERDLERWVAADVPDEEAAPEGGPPPAPAGPQSPHPPRLLQTRFHELAVHVVKTSTDDRCPVVIEPNPTYSNLFGTLAPPKSEQHAGLGTIHPGSLLRADGGYLIVRVADLLAEPGVWALLKRALKGSVVEIREYDPQTGTTVGPLQPAPIPIDLKVVLIGEPSHYEQLAGEDPQFRQTFKVHAEFDQTVPASFANLRRYADFLKWLTGREGLCPFEPDANAALAEYGARRAGRRDRLTTCFGELADIARESSFVCEQDHDASVHRRHVELAIQQRLRRNDLQRELTEREFRDGYLLLRTSGMQIGQVTALTVVDTGTAMFGKPCRITASTAAGGRGDSGVLNIEREVALSGPIHDKGVLIMHGYLLDQFGHDGPICLQATLCMEQLYAGVEGDSASSAELYALLSSLSRLPIDQALAVTGSVNQKGELQSVGGVNEKIEGYYRLCKMRRLTGTQGVVIPRANVSDLMLDHEVVQAVEDGLFHVYAVDHVTDGLQLLTGVEPRAILKRAAAALARFRKQTR